MENLLGSTETKTMLTSETIETQQITVTCMACQYCPDSQGIIIELHISSNSRG